MRLSCRCQCKTLLQGHWTIRSCFPHTGLALVYSKLNFRENVAGTADARPKNEDERPHKKGQEGRYCWQGETIVRPSFSNDHWMCTAATIFAS